MKRRGFFDRGQSLVIYHPLSRNGTAETRVGEKLRQIREKLPQAVIRTARYRRGTSRAYFIIMQKNHEAKIDAGIHALRQSGWVEEGHFNL